MPDTDANHRYATQVLDTANHQTIELIAPTLMSNELAYVMLKKGRALGWGEARIGEYAEYIESIKIKFYQTSVSLAGIIRFAVRNNVQGYDAVYLQLAMQKQAAIATLDKGLIAACKRQNVPIW